MRLSLLPPGQFDRGLSGGLFFLSMFCVFYRPS